MRTITLVSAGKSRPDLAELSRREVADESPRITFFEKALNSDILDERFLRSVPRTRAMVYKWLPVSVAQVLEAYTVRKEYDAIISWAEHLGLSLAALLKVTDSETPHVTIFSWISKPKKGYLLKRVQSHISRLILMSSVQRNYAIHKIGVPASKIVLLRWPVDQIFWRPVNAEMDMICAVGREMRDYTTLIHAARGLDIPCHIAAGGQAKTRKGDSWMNAIKKAGSLPPHITIGGKNFAQLRELYARSRFMVMPLLPTDTDNGTTSILEAMAMGKAVICSRVEGQRDVIQDGKNGILVPPQDPASLRKAIQYLWENPQIAEQMGNEARQHIERYHTLDQWVSDVKSTVETAIVERRHLK